MQKSKPKVLVIPSWFFPYGGSFFLEQTIMLTRISENRIIYAEPVSLKNLIKKPVDYIRSLNNRITFEEMKGIMIIRKKYFTIPKLWRLNLQIEVKTFENLFLEVCRNFGKPNLLHVHCSIWGGLAALNIKEKYGIPFIITENRSRFVYNKYVKQFHLLPDSYRPLLIRILNNASKIIVVSKSMLDKIKEYCNNLLKMTVIGNPYNENLFFYDNKISKFSNFTFITIAGLFFHKGVDLLIKAFRKFIDDINSKSINLIVVGNGPEKKKLENLTKKLNLVNYINFVGELNREKVASLLKKCHVFVLPTRFEAFGISFIEALACGLPVIGTKGVGGPDEIIKEGFNGYFIEIDNVEDLAQKMKEIYLNYKKFEPTKISEDCKNRFGVDRFVQEYERIYNEVLHNETF